MMKFTKSQDALERAMKTIPLGSQTFSKSYQQFPQGYAPLFLEKGDGGRVWDIDGNEFVDLILGLLPVVLGYKDTDTDEAIKAQLDRGISFSLATELEYQLAEKLVKMIPCAEMVRYGKNGTDATSAAVRLARGFTRKDHIIAIGYHGWQDWYIGATVRNLGIPESVQHLTKKLPYNDLEKLEAEFKANDNIAAVIMEPMNSEDPKEGYLQAVKDMAHKYGAVLIFDEVITGFRYANGGAQEYFGVTPDLAAFGKGMGNGMPISAIVGREDIMMLMNDIFFSSTFGGEALSIAAANAVVDKFQREPVVKTLWETGEAITEKIEAHIKHFDLADHIKLCGKAPWMILQFKDHSHASKEALKTFLIKEVIARGVLVSGAHNICYAHDERDIAHITNAYGEALAVLHEALKKPDLDNRMDMPVIRPVFSVR